MYVTSIVAVLWTPAPSAVVRHGSRCLRVNPSRVESTRFSDAKARILASFGLPLWLHGHGETQKDRGRQRETEGERGRQRESWERKFTDVSTGLGLSQQSCRAFLRCCCTLACFRNTVGRPLSALRVAQWAPWASRGHRLGASLQITRFPWLPKVPALCHPCSLQQWPEHLAIATALSQRKVPFRCTWQVGSMQLCIVGRTDTSVVASSFSPRDFCLAGLPGCRVAARCGHCQARALPVLPRPSIDRLRRAEQNSLRLSD